MKKCLIIIGAVIVSLLMLSSVTAVGNVNSEIEMDLIENEQKKQSIKSQVFMDEIQNIFKQIDLGKSFSVENEININIDLEQDFQDLFDIEGFLDYIVSEEFINLLNNNYNLITSHPGFEIIYNMQPIQNFLQSEAFANFLNSDEVQYILSQLDFGLGGPQSISNKDANLYCYPNPLVLQIENNEIINDYDDLMVSNQALGKSISISTPSFQMSGDDSPSFLIILIGIITWIPGIIISILYSPYAFFFFLGIYLENWGEFGPGDLLYILITSFLGAIIITCYLCLVWPVFWADFLGLMTTIVNL